MVPQSNTLGPFCLACGCSLEASRLVPEDLVSFNSGQVSRIGQMDKQNILFGCVTVNVTRILTDRYMEIGWVMLSQSHAVMSSAAIAVYKSRNSSMMTVRGRKRKLSRVTATPISAITTLIYRWLMWYNVCVLHLPVST